MEANSEYDSKMLNRGYYFRIDFENRTIQSLYVKDINHVCRLMRTMYKDEKNYFVKDLRKCAEKMFAE